MKQRLRTRLDTLRANLFFLPALAIVLSYLAARIMAGWQGAAWVGQSSVESGRAVLSVVAGATITFVSIAFSVSLLVMQQGSSQFSPRVLPALIRDPVNRRVISLVMATFTFSLVTLQRVRGPLEDGGDPTVPQVSVALAVVLGIAAVLAVVAAIHHTAHMMQISSILERIVHESRHATSLGADTELQADRDEERAEPDGASCVVLFRRSGWVRGVDVDRLVDCLPRGSRLLLDTAPGRYAVEGAPLGLLSPPPADDEQKEVHDRVASAFDIGSTRTVSQDPSLAVRQLVDVALKALSPGINDPTTALDAIFHLATVLVDLLTNDQAANRFTADDGTALVLRHPVTDDELAELALGELRVASVSQPAVVIYLFEMVEVVDAAARAAGRGERSRPLIEQARWLRDHAVAVITDERDRAGITTSFARRFEPDAA